VSADLAGPRPGHPDGADSLLAALPVARSAREDLRRRMSAADRRYHGLAHLAALWSRHRVLGRGTEFHAPPMERLIAGAIAFHDAVFDPTLADNERASAALWRDAAGAAGMLQRDEVDWVARTIEATSDHLGAPDAQRTPLERARLWVLDLDLTPLGEPPARFARNARLLRAEHAHLDDAAWERQSLGFLARLQAAPRLFRTPAIAAAFEARARTNIARVLAAGAEDP